MKSFFKLENDSVRRLFNLEDVLEFTLTHDVQIIRGEDYQYYCYVNKQCYDISLTPMCALWHGINKYKKHNEPTKV